MKFSIILLILFSCQKENINSILTDHVIELKAIDGEPLFPTSFLKQTKFDILLTGEVHGIVENYSVRKSLITYLTKENGIKTLTIEFPLSSSRLIQNYLNTGDETDLLFVYTNLKSTSEYTQEGIDFFRWLKTFNSTLDANKKIQLIGVDIEHQTSVTKYYITKILKNKIIPVEIEKNIQRLLKENLTSELLMTIQKDVLQNETAYKLLFQSEYVVFNLLIKNALVRTQYGSNSQLFDEAREKAMLDTWVQLIADSSNGPVYGHFGDAHLTTYTLSRERLASLLKKNDATKSQTYLYMPFIYTHSSYRNPQGSQGSIDVVSQRDWHSQVEGQYYFYDFTNLSAKDAKSLGWPFSNALFGPAPQSGIITDYFQYFFLINNGKACTTFRQ